MPITPGNGSNPNKLDPSRLSSYKGELKVGRREPPPPDDPNARRKRLVLGIALGLLVVVLVFVLILVITTMNGPADFAVP